MGKEDRRTKEQKKGKGKGRQKDKGTEKRKGERKTKGQKNKRTKAGGKGNRKRGGDADRKKPVNFLQKPWSNLTEPLEQCSSYPVALLRGCWRKITEGVGNYAGTR